MRLARVELQHALHPGEREGAGPRPPAHAQAGGAHQLPVCLACARALGDQADAPAGHANLVREVQVPAALLGIDDALQWEGGLWQVMTCSAIIYALRRASTTTSFPPLAHAAAACRERGRHGAGACCVRAAPPPHPRVRHHGADVGAERLLGRRRHLKGPLVQAHLHEPLLLGEGGSSGSGGWMRQRLRRRQGSAAGKQHRGAVHAWPGVQPKTLNGR